VRVEVREVSKRYGRFTALDGVSFALAAGERMALVGPNGSGKSTLNRALMGLLRYEGEIRIGEASPRDDRLDVARRIAYVPQVAPALAATVREMVRALTQLRGVPRSSVAELSSRLSLDLDAVADRRVRDLSGGMKQKLLLALALASRASLLILDEPTGSLDAETRAGFFPLLDECCAGASVLLCSHRPDDVQGRVDRLLELADGRVAYDGPVEKRSGPRIGADR